MKEKSYRNRSLARLWGRDYREYLKTLPEVITLEELLKKEVKQLMDESMTSDLGKEDVVSFEEAIADVRNNKDFRLPKISDLMGQKFIITAVRFGKGNFGDYAVFTIKNMGDYRTSSAVLTQQIKELKEILTNGKAIKVGLERRDAIEGEYHTFV